MVFTIMGLFIVWYVPVGLEPVEALLGVPVVRQLPTAATVLLPATTLATVSVRLVFCCCNKINTIFNNMYNIYHIPKPLSEETSARLM